MILSLAREIKNHGLYRLEVFCLFFNRVPDLLVHPVEFWRKVWLLTCSMVFYAAWDWRFLGLVFLVIINTYTVTLLVHRTEQPAWRQRILTVGIVVSLSVLGFFKYYNFFVDLPCSDRSRSIWRFAKSCCRSASASIRFIR